MSKKALLIGINYRGTKSELSGCINDVHNMQELLISKYGYSGNDIKIITDDTIIKPSRSNIMMNLLELLLSGAKQLVFYYSGHGSYVFDKSGDEADKQDECLVPLDYSTNGGIVDDEIRGILDCLPDDAKLTIIFDCCHSGTCVDLSYNLDTKTSAYKLVCDTGVRKTRGKVIMISGCLDNQSSADAYLQNKNQGALTYSLISALNKTGKKTFKSIIKSIYETLDKEGFDQYPNLSSGTLIDIKEEFAL